MTEVVSAVILGAVAREVHLPDSEDHRREWAVRLSDSAEEGLEGPPVVLAAVLVDLQEASAVATAKADSDQ